MKKFTFKTNKATGRHFTPNHHYIKLNKKKCGSIDYKSPHRINLMVEKKDVNEDGNPNCEWKWIKLNKESKTLQEAKDFLNTSFEVIISKYLIHCLNDNK